eukprot:1178480-Prorocentrum_minimum.AAC.1
MVKRLSSLPVYTDLRLSRAPVSDGAPPPLRLRAQTVAQVVVVAGAGDGGGGGDSGGAWRGSAHHNGDRAGQGGLGGSAHVHSGQNGDHRAATGGVVLMGALGRPCAAHVAAWRVQRERRVQREALPLGSRPRRRVCGRSGRKQLRTNRRRGGSIHPV